MFHFENLCQLKHVPSSKGLFVRPYMEHIDKTRLFKYSSDGNQWGLVDDTGRIVAEEAFNRIFMDYKEQVLMHHNLAMIPIMIAIYHVLEQIFQKIKMACTKQLANG